jgi:hypothetical protein
MSPSFGSRASNIASILASIRSSPSFDCGEPTCSRMARPATCHSNCRNSDCRFSIAHHLDSVVADLRGLLKCELLVCISKPAEYPMAGKREDEQGARHPREPYRPDGSLFISSSPVWVGCDSGSRHFKSTAIGPVPAWRHRMSSSSGRAVVGDRTQEQARPCPIIESEKSCPFRRIELAMTPSRVGSGFELTDEGAPVAVVQ